MAVLTGEVKGTDWPSILDGERTDRGQEQFLQIVWDWAIVAADDVQVRLVVPLRETWLVEYAVWTWASSPGWTSAQVLRELRQGQYLDLVPPPTPWQPMSATAVHKRILYPIPSGDKDSGNVHRSQMETDLGGLRQGARWGFDWLGAVGPSAPQLTLSLQVVRIPLAKGRTWTEKDMANALTQIEGLGRRVS